MLLASFPITRDVWHLIVNAGTVFKVKQNKLENIILCALSVAPNLNTI